jgi:hypothetical protein
MLSAGTLSAAAIAERASDPCRTSAHDQRRSRLEPVFLTLSF